MDGQRRSRFSHGSPHDYGSSASPAVDDGKSREVKRSHESARLAYEAYRFASVKPKKTSRFSQDDVGVVGGDGGDAYRRRDEQFRQHSEQYNNDLYTLQELERNKVHNEMMYSKQMADLDARQKLLLSSVADDCVAMETNTNESLYGSARYPDDRKYSRNDDFREDHSPFPNCVNFNLDVDTSDVHLIKSNEKIDTPNLTLFPLAPDIVRRLSSDKPKGCRTIWIGGILPCMTVLDIKDLFSFCGPVCQIRLNNKGFCHLRFFNQPSVDFAVSLNERNLLFKNVNEIRALRVDYSKSSDDLEEYESQMRQSEKSSNITSYNHSDFKPILETMKSSENDDFIACISKIKVWMDKGNCNQRSSKDFFHMLTSFGSHLRRIRGQKMQYNTDRDNIKKNLFENMKNVKLQLKTTCSVFSSARQQRSWDHFTKPQRKSILSLQQQFMDNYEESKVEFQEARKIVDFITDPEGKKESIDLTDDIEVDESNESKDLELFEKYDKLKVENKKISTELQLLKEENSKEKLVDIKIGITEQEDFQQTITKLKRQLSEFKSSEKSKDIQIESLKKSLVQKDEVRIIALLALLDAIHANGCTIDEMYQFLQKREIYEDHNRIFQIVKKNNHLFCCISSDNIDCKNAIFKFTGHAKK